MLTLARMLSVLSAASTFIFAFVMIGVGRFNFLHLGFEGTGFAAGLSFFLRSVVRASGSRDCDPAAPQIENDDKDRSGRADIRHLLGSS